jgi:hypothetical protein
MNVSMAANTRGVDYQNNQICPLDDATNSWKWTPRRGTESYTNLNNNSGFWVDLPTATPDYSGHTDGFTFIFYGVKYKNWTGYSIASHMWVSTNGFISLDPSMLNTSCPSAFPSDAPRVVIAPFWTGLDFVPGTSEIDTSINFAFGLGYYFIVKWVNMHERGTSNFCTFGVALRVYDRNYYDDAEYQSPDDLDGIHMTSGNIWFAYYNLPTPASSFVAGVEDQTGQHWSGGFMSNSSAAGLNNTAHLYAANDPPYIKRMILTFQDSNHNGAYFIDEAETYGRNLLSVANPPNDSSMNFAIPDSQLVSAAVGAGGVLFSIDELWEDGAILGEYATPVGVVFLGYGIYQVGSDIYNWWVGSQQRQYPNMTSFVYNNGAFPTQKPNNLAQAYVSAPAYDNYTRSSDTVVDASLETSFQWVVYYDYNTSHTLTVTATVECGYRGQYVPPDYNASTSVSLNLFPDNNNDLAHAQQVTYGFYGDNPMLYLGQSPPGQSYDYDDYYWINVTTNYGTIVDVYPISSALGFSIEVLNSTYSPVVNASQSGHGDKESVQFVPTYNGTYYIHIHSTNGWGFYNMTISKGAVLSVSANWYPPGAGRVSPRGVTWWDVGHQATAGEYPTNSSYYFLGWSVDGSTTLDPSYPFISYNAYCAYVTMDQNHALVAYFAQNTSGGGCPYVYAWNGTSFVKDNNILPASETGNGTDTRDYYLLQQPLVPVSRTRQTSLYSLQIGEFEKEQDYIDQVKLIAVDHSQGTSIAVTPEGQILTYTSPAAPISCVDNNGVSQLGEIDRMDGNVSDASTYFQGNRGDWLVLDFGRVSGPTANLILRDDMFCDKVCLDVQVQDANGVWQTVGSLHPRAFWSMEAVNMTTYLPPNGDFIVRLLWTATHRVDYVGLDTSTQAQTTVSSARPILAVHSTMGVVTTKLLYDDESCVELVNGQQITMAFMLPTNAQGVTRDFILYTDGYYYTITP